MQQYCIKRLGLYYVLSNTLTNSRGYFGANWFDKITPKLEIKIMEQFGTL